MASVTVAAAENRTATDKLMDANWLARLIIDKQIVHGFGMHGSLGTQLKGGAGSRANHLPRRNVEQAPSKIRQPRSNASTLGNQE